MGRHFRFIGLLGGLALVLGFSGCSSTSDRTSGQVRSDRAVAKAVKKELAKDSKYDYSSVEPMVYEGNVQLTGFVNSPQQRQRAAELAAQAPGAKQVFNYLRLKLAPTGLPQVSTNAAQPEAPAGGSGEPEPPATGSGQGTPLPP